MRSSKMDSCNDPNQHVGLGWYAPKSVRISALQHPAGNILPPGVAIPHLSVCGMWLDRLGFKAGHRVFVEAAPGRITLRLDETPVLLPYRYRKHTPKKARAGALHQQQ